MYILKMITATLCFSYVGEDYNNKLLGFRHKKLISKLSNQMENKSCYNNTCNNKGNNIGCQFEPDYCFVF